MMTDYVRFFDTTLRDGEQSPGATMTRVEKVDVAHTLARLGVDIIEAGFAAAAPADADAIAQIASEVGNLDISGNTCYPNEPPTICSLARAATQDIDKAYKSVRSAAKPRIHAFLATSKIHLEHKLKMTEAEALNRVEEMVGYARSLCPDIEFTPEDSGRTDEAFLFEVIGVALQAGATTINIADTVGCCLPSDMRQLVEKIKTNVPGIDNAIISVHCHNDLGLATANTLASIEAGARQVEVTVNGIGERAGNAALEEVSMALQTHPQSFGLRMGINTRQITRASRVVRAHARMPVQPNKAIVGKNAFLHESGIHQDGVLKHHATYEILRPESVGATQSGLVLGKHSGRHALKSRLRQLGYELDDPQLLDVFKRFKKMASHRKLITDSDLESLLEGSHEAKHSAFALEELQVACGTRGLSTATVRLMTRAGESRVSAAVGTGPVHAAFKAINSVVALKAPRLEYAVHPVHDGIEGKSTVSVQLQVTSQDEEALVFSGTGVDEDIVLASAKAYLNALNRFLTQSPSEAAVPPKTPQLVR